jgi:hypothetical protein
MNLNHFRLRLPPPLSAARAAVSLLGLLLSGTVLAQSNGSYELRWSKVAGGGGTSANEGWEITGTIGQADAGALVGGDWAVEGGFWNGALVPANTTPPEIALLGASPLTNECHAAFVDPGVTITATCPGPVSLVTNSTVDPNAVGVYSISYVANDSCGNWATNTRAVYVVDTTPPAITLNGANPLTVECHAGFADPGATAADSCAGAVLVAISGSVDANSPGAYSLTYTADDGSGNTNQITRAVNVVDTTPPVITCPTNLSIVTTDPTGANVSFTVTATDSCDASPMVVSTPASGSFFAAGTNPVSCYTYDSSLNTNTCAFVVMVDRAPVVQTQLSFYLLQDQALSLSREQLLAVASDADNDTLSVSGADANSTNGGTVTLTSTNLTYQPVVGYTGADLFSYTVSDGRGGQATNVVVVLVLAREAVAPSVVYGPFVAAGQFVVRFAGVSGLAYTIEATDTLEAPFWAKVVNVTAPAVDQGLGVGVFEFTESLGTGPSRFYRAVYPSY